MYILKALASYILYAVAFIVTPLLYFPLVVLRFITGSQELAVFVSRFWLRYLLRGVYLVRTEVEGLEHLDSNQSYLIMCNHQSFIDIPVLAASVPLNFRWLAKASLFRLPVIGHAMSMAGFVSINRRSPRQSMKSIHRVKQLLAQGKSILVFPEGTRSGSNQLGKFKRGGISVLAELTIPVLPITICGSHNVVSKGYVINFFKRIQIRIDPPLAISEPLGKKEQNKVLERLKGQMRKNLEAMTG